MLKEWLVHLFIIVRIQYTPLKMYIDRPRLSIGFHSARFRFYKTLNSPPTNCANYMYIRRTQFEIYSLYFYVKSVYRDRRVYLYTHFYKGVRLILPFVLQNIKRKKMYLYEVLQWLFNSAVFCSRHIFVWRTRRSSHASTVRTSRCFNSNINNMHLPEVQNHAQLNTCHHWCAAKKTFIRPNLHYTRIPFVCLAKCMNVVSMHSSHYHVCLRKL